MGLTAVEREVYNYCDANDYVSPEIINKFRSQLEREDNLGTLSHALAKFMDAACPNCGSTGAYKYHFFGKLKHPPCGWSWYIDPGKYFVAQLKAVFRTGAGLGGEAMAEADKKGESQASGCLTALFGFMIGACFRLPFALLMIPIQAIVSLSQRKPQAQPSTDR